MARPTSTFGLRGYKNFLSLYGLAVLGGFIALVFVDGRPASEAREALVAALVPIGFVIVFGFGYGADLPRRVARFGPDREERTFLVVALFFLVALATVAFTLAYLTVEEGQALCLVTCDLQILGVGRWQNPFRLSYSGTPKYLAAGVGAVLVGSVQLLTTLVAPRRLGPDVPFRSLSRRVGWRAVAVTAFWGVGWLLVIEAAVAVAGVGLPVVAVLRIFAALFCVGAIAFEIWHPWGRVVSAPNGEPAAGWKVALRALAMSFVFTPWADLAVFSWTLTTSHILEFMIARVFLGLAAGGAVVHAQGQGIPDVLLKVYVRGNQEAETQSDGTAPMGSRSIRPPAFDPDPADPFAKDLLGRRSHVVGLTDRVVTLAGPATVMVDGGWGSGKTAFLRMCAADLRSRGETVIEFDAWAAQHTQRPALDLLGALSEGITDPGAGHLAAARTRLATALRGAVPDPRYDSWREQRRAATSIRQSLESAAAGHGRLVLIIDELDRCPPSYALEALADIHHLFAVERVVVIVGVNRGELCEVVRTVYGPQFKADGYLRRLADIHISLPATTQIDTSDFFANALREAGLTEPADPRSLQILRLVVDLETCALRD
ncbi:MAG: P-loop NTPase fold protein [bacterium]|nr:P-loop NTPase fold protein [bacterium]